MDLRPSANLTVARFDPQIAQQHKAIQKDGGDITLGSGKDLPSNLKFGSTHPTHSQQSTPLQSGNVKLGDNIAPKIEHFFKLPEAKTLESRAIFLTNNALLGAGAKTELKSQLDKIEQAGGDDRQLALNKLDKMVAKACQIIDLKQDYTNLHSQIDVAKKNIDAMKATIDDPNATISPKQRDDYEQAQNRLQQMTVSLTVMANQIKSLGGEVPNFNSVSHDPPDIDDSGTSNVESRPMENAQDIVEDAVKSSSTAKKLTWMGFGLMAAGIIGAIALAPFTGGASVGIAAAAVATAFYSGAALSIFGGIMQAAEKTDGAPTANNGSSATDAKIEELTKVFEQQRKDNQEQLEKLREQNSQLMERIMQQDKNMQLLLSKLSGGDEMSAPRDIRQLPQSSIDEVD